MVSQRQMDVISIEDDEFSTDEEHVSVFDVVLSLGWYFISLSTALRFA